MLIILWLVQDGSNAQNVDGILALIYISRVSDQNGVYLLYIMLEIHHSGWEPSIYKISHSIYIYTHTHMLLTWITKGAVVRQIYLATNLLMAKITGDVEGRELDNVTNVDLCSMCIQDSGNLVTRTNCINLMIYYFNPPGTTYNEKYVLK